MRNARNSPPSNRILAALPRAANRRFLAALSCVELSLGQVLHQPGKATPYIYFPNEGMVSMVAVAGRGGGLEVGLIGREGVVGISLALGVPLSPVRALVQGAGSAMRMSSARFKTELRRNRPLRRALDRCAYVAMATAMQVAVCNNEHLLEARLARWLLMTRDRIGLDRFAFTQTFMALMLGVRRAGVTESAGALQRRGLIRYSRGAVRILDRRRLHAASCGCYDLIRRLETG